ncbi:MAG: hypothetical protein IJQ39_06270 [Thermoguttaceae bacterium]|nr:hypothetical protein [Thermoguttaceae bacterium]
MKGGNEATNGSGITHSPERRTKRLDYHKPLILPIDKRRQWYARANLTRRRGGSSRSFKIYASFAFFAAYNSFARKIKATNGSGGNISRAQRGLGAAPRRPFLKKKVLHLKLPFQKTLVRGEIISTK